MKSGRGPAPFLLLNGALLMGFGFLMGLRFTLAGFSIDTLFPSLEPAGDFLHFFFHVFVWSPLVLGLAVLAVGLILRLPPHIRWLSAVSFGNSLVLIGYSLLVFAGINLILFVSDWWHGGAPRELRQWLDVGLLILLPWANGAIVLAVGRVLTASRDEQ